MGDRYNKMRGDLREDVVSYLPPESLDKRLRFIAAERNGRLLLACGYVFDD